MSLDSGSTPPYRQPREGPQCRQLKLAPALLCRDPTANIEIHPYLLRE
jgi:hypothetical protein